MSLTDIELTMSSNNEFKQRVQTTNLINIGPKKKFIIDFF